MKSEQNKKLTLELLNNRFETLINKVMNIREKSKGEIKKKLVKVKKIGEDKALREIMVKIELK